MKPIAAGQLRHRVRVETPTSQTDEFGDPLLSWALVGVRWAAVSPVGGNEGVSGDAVRGDRSYTVVMRSRGLSISPKDRIVTTDGVILEVQDVIDADLRRLVTTISCVEIVD